ncbi:uncharacterized protein KQ657_001669 [Scheffersomyces spartinae]|uniref:Flavodoxin-like domain-containing protein n=1 Tax=Scheffersomyces spartinae TaxID=45513 RepID=A0A9P8AHW9_9ASCO|nr:uncharacterized protein KQ657_001669 [Scheffersomyces spartinae]KAG7192569.1 hypothetical protein KQ657_001669 [Scheffersomyces spartinae]
MKVAVVVYSTWGHIYSLADKVVEGIKSTGAEVELLQVAETLSEEVLTAMHAPPKRKDIPVLNPEELPKYDAFVFGFPTRFGAGPAQIFEFWGQTGGLWASAALAGKPASFFVSSGTPGGGQEVTLRNSLSFFAHHGMPYIPLGYKDTFAEITNLEEIHGGSSWGAGTYAGSDGSRQPTELELTVAYKQGVSFATHAVKFTSEPEKKSETNTATISASDSTTNIATKPAAKTTETSKTARQSQQEPAPTATKSESKCCVIV